MAIGKKKKKVEEESLGDEASDAENSNSPVKNFGLLF